MRRRNDRIAAGILATVSSSVTAVFWLIVMVIMEQAGSGTMNNSTVHVFGMLKAFVFVFLAFDAVTVGFGITLIAKGGRGAAITLIVLKSISLLSVVSLLLNSTGQALFFIVTAVVVPGILTIVFSAKFLSADREDDPLP